MAFNLGDIIVTIKAKTDDLKKGIDEVQNLTDKAGNGVGKLEGLAGGVAKFAKVAAVGMAAAGAAATAFGVISVKAFTESEDVMAQTEAVIKSTGGAAGVTAEQAQKLASSFQNVTKFSDETVQSGENILLTFTNIGKDIFPQATETMLNMSQALGQDVKSSAIQLGKALQDPIQGVTALRRVGVNFNDAQQETIAKLVETGRAGEAQAMILKELQTEFGGSAKAAGETFAGKLTILKNKFNDIQEAVGGALVKAVTPFVDKFSQWLDRIGGAQGLFDSVVNMWKLLTTGDFKGGIFGLAEDDPFINVLFKVRDVFLWLAGFGRNTLEVLKKAWDFIAPSVMALWKTIKDELWPTVERLIKFLWPAIKVIAIILGVALVGAIWLVINALNIVINIVDWVVNAFITGFRGVVDFFQWVYNTIISIWQGIYQVAVAVWQAIVDFVTPIINAIISVLQFFLGIYTFIFQTLYAIAVWAWQAIYNAAIKPVIDMIAAAINWLGGIIAGVWNWILGVARPVFQAIGQAAQGAWNWIVGIFQGAVGWFNGIWNGIANAAKNAFGGLGNVLGGAWEGMKNGFKAAANWVIDMANKLINGYNNSVGKIPGTPKIGNLPRFARGTEDFAGGGAIVGEEGPELGLFPSGSKIVPANLTRNLVDNLMSVGDMMKMFLSAGAGAFLPAGAGVAAGGASVSKTVNFNGPINIDSQQDADYLMQRLDRSVQLESMGLTPNE